ncbi:hypothetical protein EYF80_005978 [Liparis tanakae]|uniref:Uncharacterized protein n=1 Tax=Liparis tanakae TaxID=230148 RepID=A0A4Z2J2T3_9TELE|nr:hypothetical protein EYF80_005978 [Liparis tanakae]
MSPVELRTVRSYWEHRSSRDFTRRLCPGKQEHTMHHSYITVCVIGVHQTFTASHETLPLEPHRAMMRGLLLLSSSLRQALPARSLMTDSSLKMRAY